MSILNHPIVKPYLMKKNMLIPLINKTAKIFLSLVLCISFYNSLYAQDLYVGGTNSWVLSAPSTSTNMFLAPKINGSWAWNNQTTFFNNGEVRFQGTVIAAKGVSTVDNSFININRTNSGTLLKFNTERPWEFSSEGTGAANSLTLRTLSNGKSFYIKASQGNRAAEFFLTNTANENLVKLVPDGGRVGIGTDDPKAKLAVNGDIRAKEVRVMTDIQLADYVFDEDYKLRPLTEVEQYVQEHKHLPEIPSAAEVKENGMDVAEFQNKLLQKIEELTLYMIEQQKQLEALKKENLVLKSEINSLQK